MSLRRTVLALSLPLALCVPARDARAQETPAVPPGARVRVTYSLPATAGGDRTRVEAAFVDLTDERLRLASRSDRTGRPAAWDVPRTALVSLERSDGRARGRGALRGAWIGGIVGTGLGLATWVALPEEGFLALDSASEGMMLTVLTTVASAGLGALIGVVAAPTDWRDVPVGEGAK